MKGPMENRGCGPGRAAVLASVLAVGLEPSSLVQFGGVVGAVAGSGLLWRWPGAPVGGTVMTDMVRGTAGALIGAFLAVVIRSLTGSPVGDSGMVVSMATRGGMVDGALARGWPLLQ